MELLDKYNLKPLTILKFAGVAFVVIILIAFAVRLVGSTVNMGLKGGFSDGLLSSPSMMNEMAYDQDISYKAAGSVGLSARNIAPSPIEESVTMGDDSEDFEITEYNGTIETRDLDKTCQTVADLKTKDYVIFENANEYDTGCNYSFKVKKDNQAEILAVIESLNPKNLIENTRTIKRLIDDFTSEIEILNKKKETIESTLNDAINSYDEISRVATQARDAESLAKIIDSKVRIIEKLSQERININTQLDRLGRQKAEQVDRLEYTYFNINIYENKFVDGEQIRDSWKREVKLFVDDTNKILQDSSIGLVSLIFYIIQFALYLIIIVFTLKLGWKFAKRIWNK